eukprot:1749033-Amphidinium_carterae.1
MTSGHLSLSDTIAILFSFAVWTSGASAAVKDPRRRSRSPWRKFGGRSRSARKPDPAEPPPLTNESLEVTELCGKCSCCGSKWNSRQQHRSK